MAKKFICLLMATSVLTAVPLFAQGGAPATAGTLTLDKKTYPLKRALAYETAIGDERAIVVVFSNQAVTNEMLQEARAREKDGGNPNFTRPFLRLVYEKTGKFKHWSAAAGGTQLGGQSGQATGELKMPGDRVIGKASQALDSGAFFPASFDAHFDVALLKAGQVLSASTQKKTGPAANVKPTVSGAFRGNGKEAKLAFVSARWVEPFDDKTGIELTFTEKDHSKEKNPGFNAGFSKFGSALIISLHEDGQIYGCQVVHSAHEKKGFSSIGNIEAPDFSYENGKVEGELTTHGQVDTFGETWEVQIKFVAPLGETPKEFQVAAAKEPERQATPAESESEGDDVDVEALTKSVETAAGGGAGFKAKDLALTKDATGVEYKGLVEQLVFRSKSSVKNVCAELAAGLKAQGWENDGRDMVNPQSSILKRKRGEATLTIFVKPDNGGSEVKMMTEGLSWD